MRRSILILVIGAFGGLLLQPITSASEESLSSAVLRNRVLLEALGRLEGPSGLSPGESCPLIGELRRAPRFPVAAGVEALVNGEPAGLVNVSVNGAQLLSPRILKPTQYVRMALREDTDTLKVEGEIA